MWWDLSKCHMALAELSVLLLLSDVHVIPPLILSRSARMATLSVTDMPAGDWSSSRHQQSDFTCLTSKIINLHTKIQRFRLKLSGQGIYLSFKSYGKQWCEAKGLRNSFNRSRNYMILCLLVCFTITVYEFSLYIDGWVQKRHNPIANALELHLSCTNSSMYSFISFFGMKTVMSHHSLWDRLLDVGGSSLVQIMAFGYSAASLYLTQWQIYVNWTIRNIFQWNLNQNTISFTQNNYLKISFAKCGHLVLDFIGLDRVIRDYSRYEYS